MLDSNTPYLVSLSLVINTGDGARPSGIFSSLRTASGSIDPYFYIDPTFPDESLYSILTSDGVGNSAPITPAPAALPLFAGGLGALGLLGWRRKRKARTLA